jgi:hypothetical protein
MLHAPMLARAPRLLALGLAVGPACHRAPDPTFDADAQLITAWAAAHTTAPDAVMLELQISHVDADGGVHYAHDGSLALTMLSMAELHRHDVRADVNDVRGSCKNLWQIVGQIARPRMRRSQTPASGEPDDPTFHTVTEWRPGTCSTSVVLKQPPRCLVTSIWKRAIADGASPDARATIKAVPLDTDGLLNWSFEIAEPRFARDYIDDCGADRVR